MPGGTQPEMRAAAVITGKDALLPGIRRGPAHPFRFVAEIAERFLGAETEDPVQSTVASRSGVLRLTGVFERRYQNAPDFRF